MAIHRWPRPLYCWLLRSETIHSYCHSPILHSVILQCWEKMKAQFSSATHEVPVRKTFFKLICFRAEAVCKLEIGSEDVSLLERCPHFRGCYVQAPMELGPEDVSLLERCLHFRGCYVQASMELGPDDVSLLERCPHFRGCYVQASVELGPEDVSLLERCPHFRGCYVQASMELGPEDVSLLERCPHFRGCVSLSLCLRPWARSSTRLHWSCYNNPENCSMS